MVYIQWFPPILRPDLEPPTDGAPGETQVLTTARSRDHQQRTAFAQHLTVDTVDPLGVGAL